jgi:predicted P-loop ATPase
MTTPAPNGHDASSLLEIAARFPPYRQEGKGYKCTCPCHPDHDPSLDVTMGDKGVPVVHCRAGCDQARVWAAVRPRRRPRPDRPARDKLEGIHVYHDARGAIDFRVHRWRKPDGSKVMPQSRPDGKGGWLSGTGGAHKGALYRLPRLLAAPPDEPVVVVEGEAKVEALEKLGVLATCNAGGAGKWTREHARQLGGHPVIVLPDNDPQCHAHAATILATLPHARTVQLPDLAPKGDIVDWLRAGGTPEQLRTLLLEGPPVALTRASASDRAPATDADARSRAPAREDASELRAELVMDGKVPAKNEANVVAALEQDPRLAGRLRWDTLAKRPEVGAMPWRQEGDGWDYWTDQDDIHLAIWLQRNGLNVRVKVVKNAVVAAAAGRAHNPIEAYLGALAWDGTDRITAFFQTYFGTVLDPAWKDHAEYLAHAARTLFAQAAARGLDPGCQADYTIVLESRQGRRKSTSLAALVPDKKWFTSQLAKIGTKDAHIDLLGKWIVELSELSAVRRVDVATVKLFLTQDTDHYRALYETHSTDHPRACTFIATTNDETYLPDETGNRRIVPVRVGMGRIDLLVRDRDQLWGQAVALHRDGYAGWERLEELAEGEQEERRQSDPWEDIVRDWLARQTFAECTSQQVLDAAIRMPAERQDRTAKMRVGHAMRLAGWTRHLKRDGTRRAWVYRPAGGDGGDGGDKKTPYENNVVTTGTTGTTGVDDENTRAHTRDTRAAADVRAGTEPKQAPRSGTSGTSGDNPSWTDWTAWHRASAAGDPAHKRTVLVEWLAAAGGALDARGKAWLPKGLPDGDAKECLTATLASISIETRER